MNKKQVFNLGKYLMWPSCQTTLPFLQHFTYPGRYPYNIDSTPDLNNAICQSDPPAIITRRISSDWHINIINNNHHILFQTWMAHNMIICINYFVLFIDSVSNIAIANTHLWAHMSKVLTTQSTIGSLIHSFIHSLNHSITPRSHLVNHALNHMTLVNVGSYQATSGFICNTLEPLHVMVIVNPKTYPILRRRPKSCRQTIC